MKSSSLFFSIALILLPHSVGVLAQEQKEPAFEVAEKAPNHRLWSRTLPDGRKEQFTELQTGLYYLGDDGEFKDSEETISIDPNGNGAFATTAPHKVHFPNMINDWVDITDPNGLSISTKIFGLAYVDLATGESVLINSLKANGPAGEIQASKNEIIWNDCFVDFKASVRWTFRKSGAEQDILLLEVPPPISAFAGAKLNEATTRLAVVTEFLAPEPRVRRDIVSDSSDDFIDFGAMHLGFGKGFLLADDKTDRTIPVFRTWAPIKNQTFLFEEVRLSDIKPFLAKLKPSASTSAPSSRRFASMEEMVTRSTRSAQASRSSAHPIQFASIARELPPTLCLDFTIISAAQTNYIFKSGETYYLSGNSSIALNGTTTTFEGGAVIKSTNTTVQLTVNTPVVAPTSTYRPVVFTSKDDDTQGQKITSSSGSPSGANYGKGILLTSDMTLTNFRFVDTIIGIEVASGKTLNISDSQFVTCGKDFEADGTFTLSAENCLFASSTTLVDFGPTTATLIHCTLDSLSYVGQSLPGAGTNSFITVTNTLFNSVGPGTDTTWGFPSSNRVEVASGKVNSFTETGGHSPFQTMGAGARYLAYNSQFRDQGTRDISPALLARLSTFTTFAPVVWPADFKSNTTLGPVVPRDDDGMPDVGYHYPVIDYAMKYLNLTNCTVVLTNGATIAVYGGTTAFTMRNGGKFVSTGTSEKPNHLVWYNSVQEQPALWDGRTTSGGGFFYVPTTSVAPTVQLSFTDVSFPATSGNWQLFYLAGTRGTLAATDCILRGAQIYLFGSSGESSYLNLTNNVLHRCNLQLWNGYSGEYYYNWIYLYNNLLYGGTLSLDYYPVPSEVIIRDNLFDTVTVSLTQEDAGYPLTADHNGFKSTTAFGSSNKSLGVTDYQSGFGSDWYYPASGGANNGLTNLVNAGSRTASSAILSSYTVTTNQVTDASTVDIGFHRFSLNLTNIVTLSVPVGAGTFGASENDGFASAITFTRTDTNSDLIVNFLVSGTATWSVDYTNSSGTITTNFTGSITIAAGSLSTNLLILPIDDSDLEFHETVKISLVASNNYTLGNPNTATLIIQDDDDPNATSSWTVLGDSSVMTSAGQIDFSSVANGYVFSNHENDTLNTASFELLRTNGTFTTFSGIGGLFFEIKLAVVPSSGNGFTNGDVYFSPNVAGTIGLITANGASSNLSWVSISGETNAFHGAFWFDRTGIFGNDLIAISGGDPTDLGGTGQGGGVYRIKGDGTVTKITQLTEGNGTDVYIEGAITFTNDFSRFGPWAGKIVGGSESRELYYSIDTSTNVLRWNFSLAPEDIDIVPVGQNIYVVDNTNPQIYKAPASVFSKVTGAFILLDEEDSPSEIYLVRWVGGYFDFRKFQAPASSGALESVVFGP